MSDLAESSKHTPQPGRVLGMRALETLVMSVVAGAFSSYIALKIVETRVEYLDRNVQQLTSDIRDIRNYVLTRNGSGSR